ncbi:hypothetical protein PG989_015330 [Apiospora arundinis]
MPSDSPEVLREREWERHRMRIWHLLLQEKLQLDEIRDRMKSDGFCATLNEYRSRLRSWGFFRNNPKPTRNYITHRVEKRKRQGKGSDVVVAGIKWSAQKIQKETCRNFYPTHEIPRDASPCTPPGPKVSVCSPTPYDLTIHDPFEWPSDLPWLRFTNRVSEAPVDVLGPMVQRLLRVTSDFGTNEVAIFGEHSSLPLVARHMGLSLPPNISNPVKLSGYFRSIMPEAIRGEHLLRCQSLTKDLKSAARECVIWSLYQISNKSFESFEYEASRDELLLDLITQLGLVGSKDPLLEEPTVASILEEVWCAALRRCRATIVSWILDISTHLNMADELVPCQISLVPPYSLYHKPLILVASKLGKDLFCCSRRDKEKHPENVSRHDVEKTMRILLAHGASPDCFCCDHHGTPLDMAVKEGLLDTVKAFMEHAINIYGQEYLQMIDFDTLVYLPSHRIPLASQHGMLDYLRSIYAKAIWNLRDPLDALICPKGLINAAVMGGPALLSLLQSKKADFNCHNLRGKFPLGSVIAEEPRVRYEPRRFERCELLLTLGASVNYVPARTCDREECPSALHIASVFGHDDIVRFLLNKGAHHHTPARLCVEGTWLYGLGTGTNNVNAHHARSPLSWALSQGWQDCAALLLESGAPIEGHELLLLSKVIPQYFDRVSEKAIKTLIARGAKLDLKDSSGKTALDIAINNGNHKVANILIRSGANIDPSISLNCLEYLKIITSITDEDVADDFNMLLENWYRLYPCESVQSQSARLDVVANVTWDLRPLRFLLNQYPHAYSSNALKAMLRRITHDNFTSSLSIIHDLLRRRRPALVDIVVELEALCELLFEETLWGSTDLFSVVDPDLFSVVDPDLFSVVDPDLFSVVDLLLSQQPSLSGMRSNPWANPLIAVFGWRFGWEFDCLGSERYPVSNALLSDFILDKFLHYGFKANTALGLMALRQGCSIDQLQKLMALGFDPRKRYRWSHTALQYAVESNDSGMVSYLLSCGVNVNGRPLWADSPEDNFGMVRHHWMLAMTGIGRTALQLAVENGNWECVELLVNHGADVNAPPARISGATALQLAAMKGYTGLVGWLISRGAKVHAQGASFRGMTAMEGAAAFGRLDVVKLLFEYGDFRSGEGRCQCIRAVGFVRKTAHHALGSYMEHQVGWSEEDEKMLVEEGEYMDDFLEEGYFDESNYIYDENYQDHCGGKRCTGETESIDEEMDEPACCRGEVETDLLGSRDGESDAQDFGETDSSYSTEAVSTDHGDEVSEPYSEQNNHRMGHVNSTETQAYGETFDGSLETQILADRDWGFLANAGLRYEGQAMSAGVVLGEVTENEGFTGEPFAPVPVPGWVDGLNSQGGWMDFPETQVWEPQPANPFLNMDVD